MTVERATLSALHGPLQQMDDHCLDVLAAMGAVEQHAPAGSLLTVGENADRFHIVTRGRFRVAMVVGGRRNVTIQTLRPGDLAGLSWMFEPREWLWDVVAVEPSETVAFSGDEVLEKAHQDPDFHVAILEMVAIELHERLMHTRMQLLDLFGAPT